MMYETTVHTVLQNENGVDRYSKTTFNLEVSAQFRTLILTDQRRTSLLALLHAPPMLKARAL